MIKKVLIANRGEIAIRIIRGLREMGIESVAICSDIDREALHAQLADETVCIGPMAAKDSYLRMDRILSAALSSGADAIHPGFGFLSENSKFASLCEKCGLTFIGPSPEVIENMGNKAKARETMIAAGVNVVPGMKIEDGETGLLAAKEIGFPVMIKASAGGGGKGMRIVESEKDFMHQFETASQEALNAFGDDSMYLERYIPRARHIEFQILADNHGNVIHLGERDCSVQRRHQKMIEEAPSLALSEELRREMGEAAIKAAKAAGYTNAGTIEFILDEQDRYYFIEMNTRIQVEHGITELITGVDLIQEQIKIASGEVLSLKREDIRFFGHAIECRINAENPYQNFMPSPGRVTNLHLPGGNGIRVDSCLYAGYKIPPSYDSLVIKLMAHGADREQALRKIRGALGELVIEGVTTNIDFQYEVINDREFIEGRIDTGFIERYLAAKSEAEDIRG